MLGGAEINGANVVGETLCSKSFNRNRLKKFMHVGIDVTCMYVNFDGCGLYGFGDTSTLKNGQISLSDHGLELRRIMLAEGRHFGRWLRPSQPYIGRLAPS